MGSYINLRFSFCPIQSTILLVLSALRTNLTVSIQSFLGLSLPIEVLITSKNRFFSLLRQFVHEQTILDEPFLSYALLMLPLLYHVYFHFYSISNCVIPRPFKHYHLYFVHVLDMLFLTFWTVKPIKHDSSYTHV